MFSSNRQKSQQKYASVIQMNKCGTCIEWTNTAHLSLRKVGHQGNRFTLGRKGYETLNRAEWYTGETVNNFTEVVRPV